MTLLGEIKTAQLEDIHRGAPYSQHCMSKKCRGDIMIGDEMRKVGGVGNCHPKCAIDEARVVRYRDLRSNGMTDTSAITLLKAEGLL